MSSCAFCRIAAAYHPVAPSTYLQSTSNANSNSPSAPKPGPGEDGHAFLILSTKHVLAFLDIMPLTRGHVLVVPRNHHEKLAEVGVRVSREVCNLHHRFPQPPSFLLLLLLFLFFASHYVNRWDEIDDTCVARYMASHTLACCDADGIRGEH